MKAVQFEKAGGSEVIRVLDLPIPAPNRGEVRVKVEACGLNFSDIMIRQGRYVTEVPFPYRVGREFSGRIDAVGDDVGILRKDDEVFGLSFNGGAMAEYVVVEAAAVSPVPLGVSPAEAAALQIQGINALLCVQDYGRVQEGETVVVHSATGGVVGLPFRLHLLGARRSFVDRGRDLAP